MNKRRTPGPWKLFYTDNGPDGIDAIVSTGKYDIHVAEIMDGCLVAAAPELLEACKYLLTQPISFKSEFDEATRALNKIRSAIAKAEGGE